MSYFKRYPSAAALSLAAFIACASTGNRAPTLHKTATPPGTVHNHDTKAPDPVSSSREADIETDTSPDSSMEDPGELIECAKTHCSEGNFAAADSLLKRAIHAFEAIDAQSDNGGEEWFPLSNYLDEIIAIYKEKMPAPYSIPDDIAMAELQRQMIRSLDSIKMMPPESISVAAMKCMKDISYDIPMVWNERVQRALHFYIKYRKGTIDRWFERARYYLPAMRRMFADSGLPQDLAYLPLIESGFNPQAYSYAHASGIWQFIASTGKTYGLRRSFWLDERRDPFRSTEAAIAYLKKLYGDFGDWHLALAAYNCGENGVARCIARHKTNDYWLLKRLPAQTRSYVPCYLAAVTIAKNPRCFGIALPEITAFPLDTVHVNDCISLADIASGIGVSPDTLKKLNPHIMRWCTPPDASNILLYLPTGTKNACNTFFTQLPPEKLVKWNRYQIQRGDDLSSLERQYNLATGTIKSINRLGKDRLVPGHHLFIPASAAPLLNPIALSPPPEHELKALDIPDYEFSGIASRHRIRKGDNLSKIAKRYHTSINQLCRWNRISRTTMLRPGRILIVSRPQQPKETAVSAPSAPAVQATDTAGIVAKANKSRIVRRGESPFSIAKEAGIPMSDLIAWNSLDPARPMIHPGDTLVIAPPDSSPASKTDSPQSLTPASETSQPVLTDGAAAAGEGNPGPNDAAITEKEKTPAAAWATAFRGSKPEIKADDAPEVQGNRSYRVQPGDNLFRISQRFSVPLQALLDSNNLKGNAVIHAGDTLLIPSPVADNATPLPEGAASSSAILYRIKQGDTILRIAEAFGVPIEEIYKNNNMKPTSFLIPGKVIIIKAGG